MWLLSNYREADLLINQPSILKRSWVTFPVQQLNVSNYRMDSLTNIKMYREDIKEDEKEKEIWIQNLPWTNESFLYFRILFWWKLIIKMWKYLIKSSGG